MVELILSLVTIAIAAVTVYYAREAAAASKGTVEPMRLTADGIRRSVEQQSEIVDGLTELARVSRSTVRASIGLAEEDRASRRVERAYRLLAAVLRYQTDAHRVADHQPVFVLRQARDELAAAAAAFRAEDIPVCTALAATDLSSGTIRGDAVSAREEAAALLADARDALLTIEQKSQLHC